MQEILNHTRKLTLQVGDLDYRRNLKIRTFPGLVLDPVFHDMQSELKYGSMGARGITPGQYFQDFENVPSSNGYGDDVRTDHQITLSRCITFETRAPESEAQRVERLIIETRAQVNTLAASGQVNHIGFDPGSGAWKTAGSGRILHILTSPHNPPGQRRIVEVPDELKFLKEHTFEGPFPTIDLLSEVEDGYSEIDLDDIFCAPGTWGVANSDIFLHVNAREYLYILENRIVELLAAKGLPLEKYFTRRSRIIFRKPSFVGERFVLRCRLFARGDEILALGAYHNLKEGGIEELSPSVFLRLEGLFI